MGLPRPHLTSCCRCTFPRAVLTAESNRDAKAAAVADADVVIEQCRMDATTVKVRVPHRAPPSARGWELLALTTVRLQCVDCVETISPAVCMGRLPLRQTECAAAR